MNNRKCYLAALVYLLAAMGGTAQIYPDIDPEHLCRVAAHEQIKTFFEENPQALERHKDSLPDTSSSGASGSLCNSGGIPYFWCGF